MSGRKAGRGAGGPVGEVAGAGRPHFSVSGSDGVGVEQRSSGESDADVCGADYREGIAAYQAAIALVTAHRGGDLATEIGLIEAVLERVGPVLMMATFTALVSQVLDRLDQPTVSGGGDGYLCQLGQHTALVGLAHDRAARPRN